MNALERALEYAEEEVAWWQSATPEQQLQRPRKYLMLAESLLESERGRPVSHETHWDAP